MWSLRTNMNRQVDDSSRVSGKQLDNVRACDMCERISHETLFLGFNLSLFFSVY